MELLNQKPCLNFPGPIQGNALEFFYFIICLFYGLTESSYHFSRLCSVFSLAKAHSLRWSQIRGVRHLSTFLLGQSNSFYCRTLCWHHWYCRPNMITKTTGTMCGDREKKKQSSYRPIVAVVEMWHFYVDMN